MFVCNCNGITERQVEVAVQAGAEHWTDVHAYYNSAPQCGKCQSEIIDTIAEHRANEPDCSDPLYSNPHLLAAT